MIKVFSDKNDSRDLEEVIRNNIRRAAEVRKELTMVKERDNSVSVSPVQNSVKISSDDSVSSVHYDQEEYKYYYDNIIDSLKGINNIEDKKDAVIQNLPCTENKNYCNIINRIKLEVLKTIYDLSIEDANTKEELLTLLHLLDYAFTYKINADLSDAQSVSNKLVFLNTVRGNLYASKDLSGLEEAYPYFQGLLESIENGTFKGVKRFDNNGSLAGISEVRDYQARVIFDRLDKNTYVIIQMFIKKTSKNSGYFNMLSNRIGYYRSVKETIKNSLNDVDYLLAQEEIRDNLMDSLENKDVSKMKKLNRGDK